MNIREKIDISVIGYSQKVDGLDSLKEITSKLMVHLVQM